MFFRDVSCIRRARPPKGDIPVQKKYGATHGGFAPHAANVDRKRRMDDIIRRWCGNFKADYSHWHGRYESWTATSLAYCLPIGRTFPFFNLTSLLLKLLTFDF